LKTLNTHELGEWYIIQNRRLNFGTLPNLNTWNSCGWRNHHLQYVLHISRVSRLHVGMQIGSQICVVICVWTGIFTRLGISFHILFDNIVKSHHRHRSLNFFFSWMSDVILENLQMSWMVIFWLKGTVWIKKIIFLWKWLIYLDNVLKCDVEVPKRSEYSNLLNQNS